MNDPIFHQFVINTTRQWCQDPTKIPLSIPQLDAISIEMLHVDPLFPIYYIVSVYPDDHYFMIEQCLAKTVNCTVTLCGEC